MTIENIPFINEVMRENVSNKVTEEELHKLKDDVLNKFIEGSLFVVNGDNVLKGLITDGDVRKSFTSNDVDHDIEKFVSRNPQTISHDENTSTALRILREKQINILPIVDNDKKLVGYITLHMLLDIFSPERLYLTGDEDNINDNEERHLSRYIFASNFIKKDSSILDCACGSGYGSKILSMESKKVLGVDLSQDAIDFANKNNCSDNIEFIQEDIGKLDLEDDSLDAVVSIETLEHVPHEIFLRFLEKVSKILKSGGVFIGSSPMLRYKNGKPYITNPYHINEMPKDQFINEINQKLDNFVVHYYYQDQDKFLPLCNENTGFCIVVARKV